MKSAQSQTAAVQIKKDDRMAWTDAMAHDDELSDNAFRVACVIGFHFNKNSGETFLSMETIARVMKASVRTVWGGVKDLEDRGYMIVERRELGFRKTDGRPVRGGKGVANIYRPAVQRTQISASFDSSELAKSCDLIWSERTQKNAPGSAKEAADCVPTLDADSDTDGEQASLVVFDLVKELLTIAGHDPDRWPSTWHDAPTDVANWLSRGWKPAVIVGAKLAMARKRGGPPTSVRYFEKCIEAEYKRFLASPPEARRNFEKVANLLVPAPPPAAPLLPAGHRSTSIRGPSSSRRKENDYNDESARLRARHPPTAATPVPPAPRRIPVAPASKPDPKIGTYQREIANAIGQDGWAVLMALREDRLEELCMGWKAGTVSPEELDVIVLEVRQRLATGPPVRKISTA